MGTPMRHTEPRGTIKLADVNDQRTLGSRPAIRSHATGVRALDATSGGLPIGALTQVTGRHAADVDLLIVRRGFDMVLECTRVRVTHKLSDRSS